MFNPCVEHCYPRYGKQYSSECDGKCEYARTVKELADVKAERDAAIRDLGIGCECLTCAHKEEWLKANSERCQICVYHGGWYYEWRGVQKETANE